jgi:RNA polymerase sigma-70 factor (ECF subfamily)
MTSDGNAGGVGERTSSQFATTHWSTVLAAGDSAAPGAREALERLCRAYWFPLYAFVRRKGSPPEDTQDFTQAFFERLIEKSFLRDVAPERGRFRSFLLAALTHFLADEWDRMNAAKRGGGFRFISLDQEAIEDRYRSDASGAESPECHFDRLWAEAVMDHALAELENEYQAPGKAAQFEALVEFLARPPEEDEYAAVGERLGLNSHAVAVTVARLRERFRILVRAEIANTVENPAEVDAELRYLIELVNPWAPEKPDRPGP